MAVDDPTIAQLKSRFERLLPQAIEFTSTVYRSSTPKYANETDLLTGEGSKRNGGRWNPVGIAVIYASLNPKTAMEETLAHHRYYGLPPEDAMPRTFVAIAVRLQSVLDLGDGAVRQRLRVARDRILNIDWRKIVSLGREPVTQSIGRAACEVGLEGLIVPSAADPNGRNLLVFPTNRVPRSRLIVLNAASLHDK